MIQPVLQRIEYKGSDKDRLLAPKFDSGKRFGTYGMIQVSIIWERDLDPRMLYYPVDNPDGAAWYLDLYKDNVNVHKAWFVPAPDQHSTGVFSPPELIPAPEEEEAPSPWYNETLTASPYNHGGK